MIFLNRKITDRYACTMIHVNRTKFIPAPQVWSCVVMWQLNSLPPRPITLQFSRFSKIAHKYWLCKTVNNNLNNSHAAPSIYYDQLLLKSITLSLPFNPLDWRWPQGKVISFYYQSQLLLYVTAVFWMKVKQPMCTMVGKVFRWSWWHPKKIMVHVIC